MADRQPRQGTSGRIKPPKGGTGAAESDPDEAARARNPGGIAAHGVTPFHPVRPRFDAREHAALIGGDPDTAEGKGDVRGPLSNRNACDDPAQSRVNAVEEIRFVACDPD